MKRLGGIAVNAPHPALASIPPHLHPRFLASSLPHFLTSMVDYLTYLTLSEQPFCIELTVETVHDRCHGKIGHTSAGLRGSPGLVCSGPCWIHVSHSSVFRFPMDVKFDRNHLVPTRNWADALTNRSTRIFGQHPLSSLSRHTLCIHP